MTMSISAISRSTWDEALARYAHVLVVRLERSAVEPKHTSILTTLPLYHRDPFDRLLVAQALVEAIPIISSDAQLDAYSVKRLW
jgi:PIN domain nuclease of toxin-antitoxin system